MFSISMNDNIFYLMRFVYFQRIQLNNLIPVNNVLVEQ